MHPCSKTIDQARSGEPSRQTAPALESIECSSSNMYNKKNKKRKTKKDNEQPAMLTIVGIKWGFKYMQFSATNTCAMDTLLMSLYLLYELGGLWEAGKNDVLLGIFQLMKEEKYDEARYKWCIDVQKLPICSSIRAFYSVDDHIMAGCKDLFAFRMSNEYSACDSDSCPNPNAPQNPSGKYELATGIKKFFSISLSGTSKKFDQHVLDNWQQNESTEPCCEVAIAEYVENKPANAFRAQIREAVDGSNDLVLKCNGIRKGFPRVFIQHPTLLHANVIVGNDVSNIMLTKPERSIRVGDLQYTLAVVIYWINQKTHFSCHVLMGNTVVYYDGMNSPKLMWQSLETFYQHKEPIAHIWYIQERLAATSEG